MFNLSFIKTRSFIMVVSFLFTFILCAHAMSFEPDMKKQKDVKYLVSMIIKFKSDSPIADQAKKLFDQNQLFSSLSGSDVIDSLNTTYKLQKVNKMYPNAVNIEAIRKRFPERAARIPKNSKAPNLQHIYKFEFAVSPHEINAICSQYAEIPYVEYAQPDQIMHAHPEK